MCIAASAMLAPMLFRWGFRGWSKSVWASLKADNVFSMTINPVQTDTPMTACVLIPRHLEGTSPLRDLDATRKFRQHDHEPEQYSYRYEPMRFLLMRI